MAIHRLTVKQIISRVRMVFPNAPENYLMNLINDAQVEMSIHNTKKKRVQKTTVKDQRYYSIKDTDGTLPDVSKINRVDFMNSDGEYIQIPRLTTARTKLNDS